MPSAVFVSAGGYHHHLGFNIWRGAGVPRARRAGRPSPACATGRSCSTAPRRSRPRASGSTAAGVAVVERDGGLLVHDPAGIPVLLALDPR